MSNIIKPALDRIEARFELGKVDHAHDYYKDILEKSEKHAAQLMLKRSGHAYVHLKNALSGINKEDDNLAAVAWFCIIAMEAEEKYGKLINELIWTN